MFILNVCGNWSSFFPAAFVALNFVSFLVTIVFRSVNPTHVVRTKMNQVATALKCYNYESYHNNLYFLTKLPQMFLDNGINLRDMLLHVQKYI